jgi:hypothetical protein
MLDLLLKKWDCLRLLGAFAKIAKGVLLFCRVCPSVRICQSYSKWMYFCKILYTAGTPFNLCSVKIGQKYRGLYLRYLSKFFLLLTTLNHHKSVLCWWAHVKLLVWPRRYKYYANAAHRYIIRTTPKFFSENLSFRLSLLFHNFSLFFFIYLLFLPLEKTGETWKPSKDNPLLELGMDPVGMCIYFVFQMKNEQWTLEKFSNFPFLSSLN